MNDIKASVFKKATYNSGNEEDVNFLSNFDNTSTPAKKDPLDGGFSSSVPPGIRYSNDKSCFDPVREEHEKSFYDLVNAKQDVSVIKQTVPDKPSEFFVDDTNHRTALQNQKLFLKKYSIDIQLPSSYVLDA